jgi:predicted amidohydrolase
VIELLCTQIPREFCEIDQLAGLLLRFCQEHVEHLRLAYDSDVVCALIGSETDDLQEWFEQQIEEDWLDATELGAVAELLRDVARRVSDQLVPAEQAAVVAARVAADALDRAHGRRFAGVFRGRGVTIIKPGDPIPVCRPPIKDLFRDELAPPPRRLGPRLHELVWLRLLPQQERNHRVRLSFESEDVLADLRPETRMGVAIPSGRLPDLRFDRADEPQPRFFDMRPRNAQTQRDAILALLDEADRAGIRIMLLPELSVDEDIAIAVERWLTRPGRSISLLVCGSMHVERDGQRRNMSPILLPGGKRVEHLKFGAASQPLPAANGNFLEHHEDVATQPSMITVLMCGDWSFTVLIGQDLVEPGVDRVLELLGVRLVLVPSCSPRSDMLEPIAAAVSTRNRAVVLVGNLTDRAPSEPASAMIARPVRENMIQRVLRSEIDPPRLIFFHFARSHEMDS